MGKTKDREKIHYLKFNLNSIQGSITSYFLLIGVLFFALLLIAIYQYNQLSHNRNFIIDKLEPAKFYTAQLSGELKEAQAEFEKALFFSSSEYYDSFEKIWATKVNPQKDSLQKYAELLENNEVVVGFSKVENELVSLKRAFDQTHQQYMINLQIKFQDEAFGSYDDRVRSTESFLEISVVPLINDLEKYTKELKSLLDKISHQYQEEYSFERKFIPGFLLFAFIVFAVTIGILVTLFSRKIFKKIRSIRDYVQQLVVGNIPEKLPESKSELNAIIKPINALNNNLHKIKTFAAEIGRGNFNYKMSVFNNDSSTLGNALIQMKNSLSHVYEEERMRSWTTEGLARFSEVLRTSNSTEMLFKNIIDYIVAYLSINQGGLFLLKNGDEGSYLELVASYAYNKLKLEKKEIMAGEGIIGQAFLEGELVYLNNLPENYLYISTGLGQASPNYLVIVPIKYNEQTIGVLELASFHEFEKYKVDFLKQLSGNIGSTIDSIRNKEHVTELLASSQEETLGMHEQQEELKQKNAELLTFREQLEANIKKINTDKDHLLGVLDAFHEGYVLYNEKNEVIFLNQKARELTEIDFTDDLRLPIYKIVNLPAEAFESVRVHESEAVSRVFQNVPVYNLKEGTEQAHKVVVRSLQIHKKQHYLLIIS